jgi:hypothetical protein
VNFLVLLFILWKLLYKPLVAKMEERTQAIKKSLEEAQAAAQRPRSSGPSMRRRSRPRMPRRRPSAPPPSRKPVTSSGA